MNEVATIEKNLSFDQIKERAALLVKSGFLPRSITTTEQAMTIMLTGHELGLGFMESLRSINVIQGKPCMSAQLLLALCYRTKEVEKAFTQESNATKCVFVLQRKGNPEYVATITRAEADQACFSRTWDKDKQAYNEKDAWKKQPSTMLQWRAISKAARVVFPDAICGLYTPEEIADDVDMIETPTGEIKVVDITSKKVDTIIVDQVKESIPSTDGAAGLLNPMEIDRLGSYMLQPPYDKNFPDRTIMEIYGTTTPGGKSKGSIFLEMVAKHSKVDAEKAVVQKFLEVIKSYERK